MQKPSAARSSRRTAAIESLEARTFLSVSSALYSYDGSGNNLVNPTWGTVDSDLIRQSGDGYGDGVSAMGGADRPSARLISNDVAIQNPSTLPNNRFMTNMVYAWGQFIDHDLDLTPSGTSELAAIDVPTGDPTFDPTSTGTATIPFARAAYDPATGTNSSNPRDQENTISSYLDGSVVYGSDATRAAALRTFSDGLLKTSVGGFLPMNVAGLPEEIHLPGVQETDLALTGDVRGNENIELQAIETLFVREHNYWAGRLLAAHPTATDQQLYDKARQIVTAEIQQITYKEFLPALMGNNCIAPYQGYNANVNAGVSAEFSEAAFRVGHSMLDNDVEFFAADGSDSHADLDFNSSADNPGLITQTGTGIANILKYLTADNAQEVDNQTEDAFRNFLFDPADHAGLDLYAIDIQRARDVGIPSYNDVRVAYGLPAVTSFNQITSDTTVQAQLQQAYGTVDKVDLFVGGSAEDHMAGSSLGATFQRILANQFERTRDGDRLWFQRSFSGDDLARIQHTTLAQIIQRDSGLANVQARVFTFKVGAICGTVFKDRNDDGTLDAGESGVKNIVVELIDNTGQVVTKQATASNGTFRFATGQTNATFSVKILPTRIYSQFTTATTKTIDLANNTGAGCFTCNMGIL